MPDPVDRVSADPVITNDSTFAQLSFANFELWLEQGENDATFIYDSRDGRKNQTQRNERDIDRGEVDVIGYHRSVKIPGITAFDDHHAEILAQPPCQLPVPDVHGIDFGGPSLQ